MIRSIVFALVILVANVSIAQDVPTEAPKPAVKEMALPKKTAFQVAVLDAVKESRKKGEMTARQALRIRVAMLSPAFQAKVEDLAVTQMAFSGTDDPLPRYTSGKIDRTAIDWPKLLVFLEKLLPFILELLDLFAANDAQIMRGVA